MPEDNIPVLPKTLYFAGALLYYGGEVLLMKRGMHKKYSPGEWAGIGGHVERDETGAPGMACLREIEEETGITAEQIASLRLRYFALLKENDELHGVYYYSGELNEKPPLIETEEGELHWIGMEDGKSLSMATHMKRIYLHWADHIDDSGLKCFLDSDIPII